MPEIKLERLKHQAPASANPSKARKVVGAALLVGGAVVAILGVTDYLGVTKNVTNLGGAWPIVGGPTCPTGQNCPTPQWWSWNEIAFLGIGGTLMVAGAAVALSG